MASGKGNGSKIKAGEAFVKFWTDQKEFDKGIKAAKKKLASFSNEVGDVGKKMTVAGAALGAPALAGLKVFGDFQKQMQAVSTMLDNPASWMPQFSKGVGDLSVRFGEATETLALGLYNILSASIDPAKALDVLAVSAKAAQAGMSDTATAVDGITTVLNAYKMNASQAGEISDWFFTVLKRGKTSFPELAGGIGQVATLAASAGLSLDEVGAALATMTRNGVKTDQAITSLKAIVSSFLSPSKDAAKVADILGFSLSSATLKAEGLHGVFKRISHLDPDTIAALFPNVRGLTGALPALQNMEGFEYDLDVLLNKAGASEAAYTKMAQGINFAVGSSRQSVMRFLVSIGDALDAPATKYLNFFSKGMEKAKNFIDQNQGLVQVTALTAVGITTVGTALLGLAAAAKIATAALGALALVKKAVLALSLANPFVLAGVAIAAAVAGLVIYNRLLREAAKVNIKDTAAKNLDSGDQRRQVEQQQMKRLRQLNESGKLNNEQQAEANKLIGQLTQRYGELGIAVDKATGKITGLTEAQKKMNASQRHEAIRQLKYKEAEQRDNILALKHKKKARERDGWQVQDMSVLGGVGMKEQMNADLKAIENEIAKAQKEMTEAQQRLRMLSKDGGNANIKALTGKSESEIQSGAVASNPALITMEQRLAAAEELKKLENSMADMQEDRAQKELNNIRQKHAEQRKHLQIMLDFEKQQKEVDQEKVKNLENQIAASEKLEKERVKKFQKKNYADIDDDRIKKQKEFDRSRKYKDQDRSIDRAFKYSPIDGIAKLQTMIDEYARQEKDAKKIADKAVKDAKKDGVITADEEKNIQKKDEHANSLRSRRVELEDRLYDARENLRSSVQQTQGTFNAAAMSIMGNGGSEAARTAAATEKTAGATEKTVDATESMAKSLDQVRRDVYRLVTNPRKGKFT